LSDFGWVFEFRWILAGIGVVLLAGIFWWGQRRSGQARGGAVGGDALSGDARSGDTRSSDARSGDTRSGDARSGDTRSGEVRDAGAASAASPPQEWGVSPLEPLSIHTGDYDNIPVLDLPIRADVATRPATVRASASAVAPAPTPRKAAPILEPEPEPELEPRAATASEQQKIVSFRVSARGEARWSGRELLAALDAQGLVFGRYGVFHRHDAEGRSLFCIASLIEPGTFDVLQMPTQEFRGVTAFAVMPGSAGPLVTFDALLAAVCALAEALAGIVQDATGATLSAQRARELREDVVQFQARLP